ncbi:C4-dicarboxylate ABC transporter substrate-binding protein, partial [Halobacteriales archaeon QS_8_69_73]
MVDPESIDRRDVLKGLGAAGVVSLAGCTGNGDGDGSSGGGQVIEWHAGGETGTYFPLSNEFKTVVDEETEFSLQVQSTGASVTNVGSLNEGEADFALIQNDIAFFAKNGESLDAFEGDPVEDLRGVATLYPETIHIVTRSDSGIESLSDLEGRSVNTGDLGSGTQINALQILESVAGLTPGDFNEQNSGFGDASDQLQNGDVDAA